MKRVKFKKGEQRKFIQKVLESINCPSLRAFLQFGLGVKYSTLKNYFIEDRLLPENLFRDMCYLSKINANNLEVVYLDENWGRMKGGSRKKK